MELEVEAVDRNVVKFNITIKPVLRGNLFCRVKNGYSRQVALKWR